MVEVPLTPDGRETLVVSYLSDVGCVRRNNEDSVGFFPGQMGDRGSLLVVADGMGGAAAGEVASRLAVQEVQRVYFHASSGRRADQALGLAVKSANAAIHLKAGDDPRLAGMGTTCTAAAVIGRELWLAHVGDSRAYAASRGSLVQLTADHSLAAEFERKGGGAEAPPRAHNVLTRCLGVREQVDVDVSPIAHTLRDGTSILLCSDGLSNQVSDGEILAILTEDPPRQSCRRLIQLARERGGPDNITALVARFVERPD